MAQFPREVSPRNVKYYLPMFHLTFEKFEICNRKGVTKSDALKVETTCLLVVFLLLTAFC